MPVSPFPFIGFADPVSSLSHLFGALLFLVYARPLLSRARGHALWQASLALFIFAAVFLLSMSGVFHLLSHGGTARGVLQRLDHAAIFVFIAATFTPVQTMLFRGRWRWGMLAFVWTCAVTGVTLKSIFFSGTSYGLSVVLYLSMGWLGLLSGLALMRRYGLRFIVPLIIGGVAYSLGAWADYAGWPNPWPGVIGPHELFHVAVLIGAASHWTFVSRCADKAVAEAAALPPTEEHALPARVAA